MTIRTVPAGAPGGGSTAPSRARAPAPIEQARLQRRSRAVATEAAALRRARAERAAREAGTAAAAPQTAPLGRTA
ncbi:hypothetical protein ACH4YN_33275 [Streptomyces griseofuscus]|uniref:hypothetical protein n=1 Tax=Streptomyces griseofuscus TaxID=146922 RepID=UPI00378A0580